MRGISTNLVSGWCTGCVVPGHSFSGSTIVLGGGGIVYRVCTRIVYSRYWFGWLVGYVHGTVSRQCCGKGAGCYDCLVRC